LLIEKAKQLAVGLEIPEGTLQFSSGWLQKLKECNGIHQEKLQARQNLLIKLPLLMLFQCYMITIIINVQAIHSNEFTTWIKRAFLSVRIHIFI
jgi:hypothetical protein